MSKSYTQMQIMLSLAYLANRQFWNPALDNQQKLAKSIANGLDTTATLKGDWELIWGPSNYRHKGSFFDSSLMYVVRHKKLRSRYAVVIRGTNPVDILDWLFGDFLVKRQVPWQPAGRTDLPTDAKISLSTALGLKILLNMRSERPDCKIPGSKSFNHLFDRAMTTAKDLGSGTTNTLKDLVRGTAEGRLAYQKSQKLINELQKKLLLNEKILSMAESTTSIGSILPAEEVLQILSVRRHIQQALDVTLDQLDYSPVDVLMPDLKEFSDDSCSQIGFLELLGGLADEHGKKLELFVTGHSKGGALAPALALFLSDTQNTTKIPKQYQWNPDSKAKIYCYAFAGPTLGNTAFANYFNKKLGRRFYSHVNTQDLVTRAWNYEDIKSIKDMYGDLINHLFFVEEFFREMSEEVKDLDYCHVGKNYKKYCFFGPVIEHIVKFTGPLKEGSNSWLAQIVYQHMDAYIHDLDLMGVVNVEELAGLK